MFQAEGDSLLVGFLLKLGFDRLERFCSVELGLRLSKHYGPGYCAIKQYNRGEAFRNEYRIGG